MLGITSTAFEFIDQNWKLLSFWQMIPSLTQVCEQYLITFVIRYAWRYQITDDDKDKWPQALMLSTYRSTFIENHPSNKVTLTVSVYDWFVEILRDHRQFMRTWKILLQLLWASPHCLTHCWSKDLKCMMAGVCNLCDMPAPDSSVWVYTAWTPAVD